jgi:hypothetical protein
MIIKMNILLASNSPLEASCCLMTSIMLITLYVIAVVIRHVEERCGKGRSQFQKARVVCKFQDGKGSLLPKQALGTGYQVATTIVQQQNLRRAKRCGLIRRSLAYQERRGDEFSRPSWVILFLFYFYKKIQTL